MGEFADGLAFALRGATDVDAVARRVLRELVALPGVSRVGIALNEGGGRRLRFLSSDDSEGATPAWSHIDAYDDVPLTTVVRTGEPVVGDLDALGGRFAALVEWQRRAGTRALAALPLLGGGAPIGGLVVYFDRPQDFAPSQRGLLDAVARRTSEAIRRVRAVTGRAPAEAAAEVPGVSTATPRSGAILLEGDPRAAGAARHFLRGLLEEWQVEGDQLDTAELCLSELVTNAVIHAGTSSELTVSLEEGLLTVVVRDLGGSSRPAEATVHLVEDDDPLRVFGRGLQLVDALADRWGSESDATGTTSWFVLALGADPHSARVG